VSAAIREVEQDIAIAARSNLRVLISGEGGVGKEVVARLIHERSPRASARLLAVMCGGVPDAVLGSALFGQVAGPLSPGAYGRRQGALEAADRGTVFLDEIGETSHNLQTRLRHFLQTGEIRPVGSDRPLSPVDVRVIASTRHPLLERTRGNRFDEELFYRLNVLHIQIPPLRERREDIAWLVNGCLHRAAADAHLRVPTLTSEASRCLAEYSWPGNIRELRQMVERIVAHCRNGRIDVEDLPDEIAPRASGRKGPEACRGTLSRARREATTEHCGSAPSARAAAADVCGGTSSVTRKVAQPGSGQVRIN
jgi:DNA-binding NtrC family response regulator